MTHSVESLARRHHAELLRVLRSRVRTDEDAADLAQEAYTRILRYEGRYTSDEMRSVLFRVAGNLLADYWRRRRRRSAADHFPIEDVVLDSGEPSLDRRLTAEQQLARLEVIVFGMPEKRRNVFILSRIQGVPNARIAERCGISIKTVEKHLAIALAECEEVDER